MNRKLFSIGFICLIALFFIPHFAHAQDSRPIVRIIYFLPKDRQPQPDINAKLDKLIKDTQQLFANQMEAHGFGRKTFQFETDTEGNAVVHHFIGQFTDEHYSNLSNTWAIWGEIDKQIDTSKNMYLTVIDMSSKDLDGDGSGIAGRAGGRRALVTVSHTAAAAHELGHVFGLSHDYRPNAKRIWKYTRDWMLASFCAAEQLDVHPAFNPERQLEQDKRSHFKMLPPSLVSPPNVIGLRFEISDPNGINQVQLFTRERRAGSSKYGGLLGCKHLNGNPHGIAEFVTTGLILKTEFVWLNAIDGHGNVTSSQEFPIDITPLLPRSETISIPDPHLAAAVQREIGNATTTHAMLNLWRLDAPNSGITDLTGLEHAYNLERLRLRAEYIEGKGYVNSNTLSDLSPLIGLTRLTELRLPYTKLVDISALSELTSLIWLLLSNNNISDVSPLQGMTQLNTLVLSNNNISDISALSALTNLTELVLSNNNISDISALSALTNLNTLWLSRNNISDISPLLALNLTGTQWNSTRLYLQSNPLSYTAINTHIPAMQAKGIEIIYTQRTPTKLLKISGDAQQAVTNSELPIPFVVQVQDRLNRAFAEVPITFSITNGSGKLSTVTTTTDTKGRAKVRLTLGQTEGETTIRATAAEISQPVQFTVKAILPTSFVQLPDTNLTAKITEILGKPTNASITAADMLTLTSLTANNTNISNLTGLQHASNLTTLMLDGNNLSNINSLTGLRQLTTLFLDNNKLSNIAPLVELAQLETLSLENNKLSDVAPLVKLTELKTLRLRGNLLNYPSLYTTIPIMRSRGVDVVVDTRTPTTLINIPGIPGVTGTAPQVIVQVQDQNGIAFAGVPVTFTLTAAGGHQSTSKATSNRNGKAITTLMLGTELGENVVSTTVPEIQQPLTFTITTIDANTLVHIPDVNLHAKIAETLNKSKNAKLNAGDLLELTRLDAPNANIQDFTSIEYAHNLNFLNLGAEYIEGKGFVNSNAVSDLQPLSRLTNLHTLYLHSSNISDISALSGLTNLHTLWLQSNNISDISALSALKNLTWLALSSNNISDISALSTLTNLNTLYLDRNNISDISALSTLTNLNTLYLDRNNISDISALSTLINLTRLRLQDNNISDISPLLALNLTGTQWGSTGLYLQKNPLSYTAINTHIPVMQAKGVEIVYELRTPTKLLKISGDAQQTVTNSELPLPFVVQVQDQWNRTFAEVPVTFTITDGEGKLSTTKTKTDTKGSAQTRLTFGETGGTTTVQVTVPNITQSIQFSATAVSLDLPVSVPDGDLHAKIVETLGKPSGVILTLADMLTLTSLTANNTNISDLTGLQHASNLTTLMLDGNNLSTIDLLTGLTQLTTLSLDNNNLSNIAPLVELAQLETLSLENNNISDIASLVELTELKTLRLRGNLLSYPSLYTTIPTLRSSGVDVVVDTRTPTTLINIPGTHGVTGAARQVIVEVQDQNGIAFAGVPVTFTLTAAGGHRSTSKATSNRSGKAITTLTPEPGENVVSATVTEIQQPLTFTITVIDTNTLVHIPDVNLRAKIAETFNKPKNATLNAGDLLKLTSLDARNANIQDLAGIEYASNLIFLNLGYENIEGKGVINSNTASDLQPLSGLTNLNSLVLSSNNISDISALSTLTNLHTLHLQDNNISDVSSLQGMTHLHTLLLSSNNISDISALSTLTNLNTLHLQDNNISDVSPLQGMTQLTSLLLSSNNISDISALSTLTHLNTLWFQDNNISDISALSTLTNLNTLYLQNNNIVDISPLLVLNLKGTQTKSTRLHLNGNPLNNDSIRTHIPAMQARGIVVSFDNITHPEFLIISGDKQEELVGRTLPSPFVVEYRDANGKPKEGVNVTFSINDGDAELTDSTVTTDADGRAQTSLQLGMKLGAITVRATAEGINTQLTFTAHVVLPENHVSEDVNADGIVDAEDLVLVAASLGTTPPKDVIPNPDVNGDGVVNSDDLALVMVALETTPTAPAAVLTAENLQRWIDEAKQLSNKSETFQRGITVLEQLLASMLPKKTVLLANYPNPFNPETWIPYHLAKPTEVTVHIYAVNGTLIRILALGHKPAGIYEHRNRAAYWDGKNAQGERVASGIYFYTLTTGNFTATRKMLIRK